MSAATPNAASCRSAVRIRVSGHIQGVGFRPFAKRLADELGLAGGVGNDSAGVFLDVEGESTELDVFLLRLRTELPESARIEALTADRIEVRDRGAFRIFACPMEPPGPIRARMPRDRAVCSACLADLRDPTDRRFRYPFTTCTTCGPRYTLLRRLPYERSATGMASFPLCPDCEHEFGDADDRRFNAETMACPHCGPQVSFSAAAQTFPSVRADRDLAIVRAAEALRRGEILALKGLGGYQLLARADDERAVNRLRERKARPTKPLAVMVRTLAEAATYAHLDAAERALLASPENPIVLAKLRRDAALAPSIAPQLDRVGLMLPTTPLHHLLLERLPFPVVATSGNRGEEPILADDATADALAALADAVLTHDRPIVRRLDDSVVRVIAGRTSVVRLARGYAPLPLPALERWMAARGSKVSAGGVLALGGQQKNATALWTGAQAILGPHLGDLDAARTRTAWRRHLDELAELYGAEIRAVAADLHPDYAATLWAELSGLPTIGVAHHHAHAAAALVEHDLLDRTVLALTWDGTGLGPDGSLWGGECLQASIDAFRRVATIRPLPLPGGETAIRQPWRIGLAMVRDAMGTADCRWDDVSPAAVRGVLQVLEQPALFPTATSMGRLFDGVASLLLGAARVSYEGEAAAWLESAADPNVDDAYPVVVDAQGETTVWDWRAMIRALVDDRAQKTPIAICAARFHNTIALWARHVAKGCPLPDVVLTGGCFQNALLADRVRRQAEAVGKRVHLPGIIPVNDGGLAAGQLAVALTRSTL